MAASQLHIRPWAGQRRRALGPDEVAAALTRHAGWQRVDGAIEKTYRFANYFETIAFVNALALIAHRQDHHPDLSVHYNRCVVRFCTHDVGGISDTDFDCAARIDALLD